MRDLRLDLRVTREEREMLAQLAQADGISVSDAIRQLFRRAHAERIQRLHAPTAGTRL